MWLDGRMGPIRQRESTGDICINEQGGYQFRLFPGGEENPLLYTIDGIPLYRWDGEKVVARSEDELTEDRMSIPTPPPGEAEQLRADIDFWQLCRG